MTDTTQTPETPAEKNGGKPETTLPATQEELNAIIQARLTRERNKFADYEELQQKAARLEEIEDANRSEAEKAARKAAQAEERARKAEQALTLHRIANQFGVPAEDLDLIEGPDEATMRAKAEKYKARLVAGAAQTPDDHRLGFVMDNSARVVTKGAPSEDEVARAFFGL